MKNPYKIFADEKSMTAKTLTLLFGGDFCPINRYEKMILEGKTIFSPNLKQLFQERDFFIVNLECPLCNSIYNDKLYKGGMGCDPRIITCFKDYFINVVGLANNHMLDKTDAGLIQTIELLNTNNILNSGAGTNSDMTQEPLILTKKGLRIGIWILAEKELNWATKNQPGTSHFFPEVNVYEIPKLREQVDFLVCYIHAGHEFMLSPSPRIRSAYRNFIDAGADAVIGHHPHVPQGFEQYNSGWIFYSLGNLVFDSSYVSSYKDTDHGYLVRMIVGTHKTFAIDIIPYCLKDTVIVEELSGSKLADFKNFLQSLSSRLVDDISFQQDWQDNVAGRWEEDYINIINKISARFSDSRDTSFLSWLRNFIQCPTHEELLIAALDMINQGDLKRN